MCYNSQKTQAKLKRVPHAYFLRPHEQELLGPHRFDMKTSCKAVGDLERSSP